MIQETPEMPARRTACFRAALVLTTAAVLVSLPAIRCSGRRPAAEPVAEVIRNLLQPATQTISSGLLDLGIHSRLTPVFYGRRDCFPAWLDDNGLRPQARSLLGALAEAQAEGLDPCEYGRDRAEALVFLAERKVKDFRNLPPRFRAEVDAVLTDAFFLYASHLSAGKVNPASGLTGRGWPPEEEGLVGLLEHSLAGDEVRPALLGLRPQHEYYLGLRRALGDFRRQVSGLEAVMTEAAPGVPLAGRKLLARQRALLDRQVETLRLNMERWRWLPRSLGRRFVLIDTAVFRLLVADRGRTPMSMKVVVGNLAWPTPVLSAEITGFIINPNWNCTPNIFYKETINFIKADKNYLAANKMVILQGWGSAEKELDPASLDWAKVNPRNYPTLHLRQLPGPLNILGRLKFIMPNPEDIYLHDTPYQDDFKQKERIFSHGCIRAEKPFDLASFLAGSPLWTKDTIRIAIDSLEELKVYLRAPVPIYVNYFTAWPGPDGRVEFRRDVYSRDGALAAALNTIN
ncbi:MAG: L,D-transpeptidase family protein [Candidatus Aminicenantes bacterium]|nr:L,D-transpeptidase family protein [Candidatus Aminicenantes bacterium]